MFHRSLSFRLGVASLVWIVVTMALTGWVLIGLFQGHIEQRFDAALYDHIEELVAGADVDEEGAIDLVWVPADPRFNLPLSGWYWEISADGKNIARSRSLGPFSLKTEPDQPKKGVIAFAGPGNMALRGFIQTVMFPVGRTAGGMGERQQEKEFIFVIAGPVSDVMADVDLFKGRAVLALLFLSAALMGMVLFQILFGLRPLKELGRALADIQGGRRERLPDTFPRELQGVTKELNALLDYNVSLLSRARAQVANLAHSLKNPLTVLKGEAKKIEGEKGALMVEQVSLMGNQIDRQLMGARVAGADNILGARTKVMPVIEGLKNSLEILYRDRDLHITVRGEGNPVFGGDSQDLEEMLGNLMDNACKWARKKVMVSAHVEADRLVLEIIDDGQGLSQAQCLEVIKRGARLDETVPGSGLGLSITADIAALYKGTLSLEALPEGGLTAGLNLPAVIT